MKACSTRRVFCAVVLYAFLSQGIAHAQSPILDSNPEFDVGDKWTFTFHNIGDKKEPISYSHQAFKSESDSGWIYGESANPAATRRSYVLRYDYKRGDAKEGFNFDPAKPNFRGKRYMNSMPAEDRIQFPLSVGKEYKYQEEWSNGEGNNAFDVKIEAFEKIQVAAGEFNAYRIKFSGWWRKTSGTNSSGQANMTQWYSPEAKRVIKIEYSDRTSGGGGWNQNRTELTQWEPKAPLATNLGSTAQQ